MSALVDSMLRRLGQGQAAPYRLFEKLAAPLRAKLAASGFARSVSVMLIGTVLGQALSLILSPVLTRLYSPEEFGALGVYTSALNILVVIAAMRYEIAMSATHDAVEVVNLFAVAIAVLVTTTLILTVFMLMFPAGRFSMAGIPEFTGFRLLLVLGFVCLGLYFILLYYATWAQEFKAISRTRISQGVSGPISQIVLGWAGLGPAGLAAGFVIGQSSGTLLLVKRVVLPRAGLLREVSWRRALQAAWKHRGFPLISSWAGLVDAAGAGQLVYLLVAALYPGSVAGYMFLAERVVARPLQMVSTSLLTVFMAEISKTKASNPALLRRRFLQVTSKQLMLAAAWVAFIDLAAYLVFARVFGAMWADAVPVLLVLSVVYLASSVVASVSHTLQALGRQSLAALWQVGRVLAVLLAFVISAYGGFSALTALKAYAAVQVISCCIVLALMLMAIDRLCKDQAAESP